MLKTIALIYVGMWLQTALLALAAWRSGKLRRFARLLNII